MTRTIGAKIPPEFWVPSILLEGVAEQSLRPDGRQVKAGEPVAALRIESMLHQLPVPGARVLQLLSKTDSVVDPGFVIGRIVLRQDA